MKLRNSNLYYILLYLCTTCISCTEVYNPKPKGYNRFDLPKPEYIRLQEVHPFTFEYSKYSKVEPHKSKNSEPHWIDISYPELNATVELTYKDIRNKANSINSVVFDSHKLANKHNVKAYAIEEAIITTDHGYTAALFELAGEVPSQFQFFITDSTNHFLRGALYFPISTKNDSLAPAINYIKKDLYHLINSLEWVN
jgi:gliding motility-associated lipoprotein GldD